METTINIFDMEDGYRKQALIQKAEWAAINEFNRVFMDSKKIGKSDDEAVEFAQAALEYEKEVQKFLLTGLTRSDAQGAVEAGMTVKNLELHV